MKQTVSLILLLVVALTKPFSIEAQSNLPSITIVNPIRGPELGLENADLLKSLTSQFQVTKESSVSATWLWQYSALENDELTSFSKNNFQSQENGIFLEIDKNTAEKSGVEYKGKIAWYQSDGLLLVSYDIYERQRIIDTTFQIFKQVFGYYPKSVGAWWVGAQSIEYMQQKYGITAVLQCADQFNTDAYSIWGTPWSIPYRPNKTNASLPANNLQNASKTVIMQWAPRDPTRAYGDSVKESTYSLQDYELKGYDTRYFEHLKNIFLKKPSDQIVFGLESGLSPESYQGQYKRQVQLTKSWQDQSKIQIKTMSDYASQFLSENRILPDTSYFLTKDYENDDQSFWYNSPNYRIGIQKKGKNIQIIDIRDYSSDAKEDFFTVPNTQTLLRINTLSTVDSIRFTNQKIDIFNSDQPLTTTEDDGQVLLQSGQTQLAKFDQNKFTILTDLKNKQDLNFFNNSYFKNLQKAVLYSEIILRLDSDELMHNLDLQYRKFSQGKKQAIIILIQIYIFLGFILTPIVFITQKNTKTSLLLITLLLGLFTILNYKNYSAPRRILPIEAELQALQFLKNNQKPVVYISPDSNLNYKSIRPFIYAKPELASKVSRNTWTNYTRQEKKDLVLDNIRGSNILVPIYTGSKLYPSEIEKYKLQKVFDNSQIEIYSLP